MQASDIEFVALALGRPDLKVQLRPEWGSQAREFRLSIRQALGRQVSELRPLTPAASVAGLLDLKTVPRIEPFQISISHCRGMGGYILSEAPGSIGFDIEETARITVKVIDRVTTPEERTEAPEMTALWSAKEAVFKAMQDDSAIMTDINIGEWSPVGGDRGRVFVFKAKAAQGGSFQPLPGQGLAWITDSWVFAFFSNNR
jgi:hypothetical protein